MANTPTNNKKWGIKLVCLLLLIGGVWSYRHRAGAASKSPAAGPPPVPVRAGARDAKGRAAPSRRTRYGASLQRSHDPRPRGR